MSVKKNLGIAAIGLASIGCEDSRPLEVSDTTTQISKSPEIEKKEQYLAEVEAELERTRALIAEGEALTPEGRLDRKIYGEAAPQVWQTAEVSTHRA